METIVKENLSGDDYTTKPTKLPVFLPEHLLSYLFGNLCMEIGMMRWKNIGAMPKYTTARGKIYPQDIIAHWVCMGMVQSMPQLVRRSSHFFST